MEQIIIAIMLYLQIIVSPATYNLSDLKALEQQHHAEIEAVRNDPGQMNVVEDVYVPRTEEVIIIYDTEW